MAKPKEIFGYFTGDNKMLQKIKTKRYLKSLDEDFTTNIKKWRNHYMSLDDIQWKKYYDLIMQRAGKRKWSTKPGRHERYLMRLINEYIEIDEKILDAGCGSGNLLYNLHKNGYKYLFGYDLSPTCINVSMGRASKHGVLLIFRIFDLENEKTNEKFDSILCCEVLEHCRKPLKVINNIYNMLNKNGIAIFCFPNLDKRSSWTHINLFYNKYQDYLDIWTEKVSLVPLKTSELFGESDFKRLSYIYKEKFIYVIGRK